MDFDAKLDELFIDFPILPQPSSYSAHAVQVGKLLFIGGILPFSEGKLVSKGQIGKDSRFDNAKLASRIAAINALAAVKAESGGTLNKVKRIVSITGYISSAAGFMDHFKVLDGASELLCQVFGGKHTRSAIGCASLPYDACVELSLIIEMK